MGIRPNPETVADPVLALELSGFTPRQADAVAAAAARAAAQAVDDLRRDLMGWHCHLALYLLAQIGVALLAILLAQAVFEPGLARRAAWARGPRAALDAGVGRPRIGPAPAAPSSLGEYSPGFDARPVTATTQNDSGAETQDSSSHREDSLATLGLLAGPSAQAFRRVPGGADRAVFASIRALTQGLGAGPRVIARHTSGREREAVGPTTPETRIGSTTPVLAGHRCLSIRV